MTEKYAIATILGDIQSFYFDFFINHFKRLWVRMMLYTRILMALLSEEPAKRLFEKYFFIIFPAERLVSQISPNNSIDADNRDPGVIRNPKCHTQVKVIIYQPLHNLVPPE